MGSGDPERAVAGGVLGSETLRPAIVAGRKGVARKAQSLFAGFNWVIMYLVLAQFGTGFVYGLSAVG